MPSLDQALATLREVQAALNAAAIEAWRLDDREDGSRRLCEPDALCPRISVSDLGGALAVEYRGSDYIGWNIFLDALALPGVAPCIAQLRVSGPDEGANGLKTWNFSSLIAAAPDFARLCEFQVEISDAGDHNQSCVDEDQLPALVAHMPALRVLTVPQAPEPGFFDLDLPRLRYIRTGGDWRTRGFIARLADAQRLPALTFVDFTDSLSPFESERPVDDPAWTSTPYADYERLFRSPVMQQLGGIRLRNAVLSEAQYRALQALQPGCQFSVVLQPPHSYVSHWGTTAFPYRHLLPFG